MPSNPDSGAPPRWASARRLLPACLAVLAAVLPGRVADGQTTITFESFGVGNAYRPGGPVAARVLVTSDLDEAVPGLVEWEIPNPDGDLQLNRRTLEVPARGGTSRAWLLGELPSRELASQLLDEPWTVRLFEYRDGRRVRELASARLSPRVCTARPIEQERGLAVVIGPNDAGLGGYGVIPGRDNRPGLNEYLDVVTNVEPADLPDLWPGLDQVDLLVWTADESRFQPATLGTRLVIEGAIRSWLERGGHLVIALPRTGDPWRLERGDGVLDDLLRGIVPITDTAYPLVDALPAVSDRAELRDPDRTIVLHRFDPATLPTTWRPLAGFRPRKPPFDPGSVEIPEGTPPAGVEILIKNARDSIPEPRPVVHAIRRSVGQGTLDIVGIDPSDPDLRVQQELGLPSTWVFWNPLLGRRTFTIPASVADDLANRREVVTAGSVDAIGRTPFVSEAIGIRASAAGGVLVAVIIFAGYWLLAGPLGFTILGRMRLRRVSWLAFVATSLVAAGVSWVAGQLIVDSSATLRHLTVLRHRYEPSDSGVETPLDHAKCWFSTRLPGYGTAQVQVGEETSDDPAGSDMLSLFSPPPRGFATGFLDVDRYEVDARRRDRLAVPSRATSVEFETDWSGRPRSNDGVWSGSIKVAPDDPVSVEMLEAGLVTIAGTLVNGTGLELHDVVVILTSPQRYNPVPLDPDGVPGIESRLPNAGLMIALPDVWLPERSLDLSSRAGFGSPRRLQSTGREGLAAEIDARFPAGESGAFALGSSVASWSESTQLQALSLFNVLSPPPITQKASGNRSASRFARLLGRDLDVSRHLAEPSLIVLARAPDAPCPVPISVEGGIVPGEGTVLLQWIHPLSVDVDWLVPPRPAIFQAEDGEDEDATAAGRGPDDASKGVALGWR